MAVRDKCSFVKSSVWKNVHCYLATEHTFGYNVGAPFDRELSWTDQLRFQMPM